MDNAPYPVMTVFWKPEEDGKGWNGEIKIWEDGNTQRDIGEHTVQVRQTTPLGEISVTIDPCTGGARRFFHFEGTGITERDLQWANAYAIEVLRNYKK